MLHDGKQICISDPKSGKPHPVVGMCNVCILYFIYLLYKYDLSVKYSHIYSFYIKLKYVIK